jgi:hypothetical protein
MTTATEIGQTAQDQVLSAVAMSSNAIIDGVRSWAEAIESITPANFNAPAIPGLENLPSPTDTVEGGFEFAQKLFNAQRDFALSLIQAVAPAIEKVEPKAKKA